MTHPESCTCPRIETHPEPNGEEDLSIFPTTLTSRVQLPVSLGPVLTSCWKGRVSFPHEYQSLPLHDLSRHVRFLPVCPEPQEEKPLQDLSRLPWATAKEATAGRPRLPYLFRTHWTHKELFILRSMRSHSQPSEWQPSEFIVIQHQGIVHSSHLSSGPWYEFFFFWKETISRPLSDATVQYTMFCISYCWNGRRLSSALACALVEKKTNRWLL